MSLPLDEPLHAKFLRRSYVYGLAPLFQASPWTTRMGLGMSILLAIGYLFWSGTIGNIGIIGNIGNIGTIENWDFSDRYANWGDYPGFWLSFYWQPESTALFDRHEYLQILQSTTPLGLKGLYGLAANCGIPFSVLQVGLITLLAILISSFSFRLTLSILPVPLAGTIASFLSLQSLWSPQSPLVPDPQTWGYLGLLLCFSALNDRSLPASLPFTPTENTALPLGLWLKRVQWSLLGSILFLALFAPTVLCLVAGVLGLQVMDRLAIVPVGRKPQTVQEFLDWTERQQRRKGKTLKQKTQEKVEWKLQLRSRRLWDLYFPSLGLIGAIGLIYGGFSYFGEAALSRYDMLQHPEFYSDGLWSYFYETPWQSWLMGHRSGLIPPLGPPLLWSGLVLPLWLRPWGLGQLPLLRQVRSTLEVLPALLLVSLVCFILAHAFVLQFGWPQDFLWISNRLVLTIATSIFLTAIAEGIVQSFERSQERFWGLGLALVALVIILKFPFIHLAKPANALPPIPHSALYDRIQALPGEQVILTTLGFQADLAPEVRSLIAALQPIVPIYTPPHTLVPAQKSSYQRQRQHLQDLLSAQYLASRSAFFAFVDSLTAGTTAEPLWLLEKDCFTAENWAKYPDLQVLYPDLSHEIEQTLPPQKPTSPGFLQTLITQNTQPDPEQTCFLETPAGIWINLSDRCVPR